ncbi:hypothetical protein K1719_005293 [Acacia pycnantha]|nr:hypothetical protein K1719_005293 [Acacia pycnantha]
MPHHEVGEMCEIKGGQQGKKEEGRESKEPKEGRKVRRKGRKAKDLTSASLLFLFSSREFVIRTDQLFIGCEINGYSGILWDSSLCCYLYDVQFVGYSSHTDISR